MEDEASSSLFSYLLKSFFGGDLSEISLFSIVMRFSSAVLVIVLTRHAANVSAMSVSGTAANTAAGAGRRPATGAVAAILGRASSFGAGDPGGGDISFRRARLLSRLTASSHPGGGGGGDDAATTPANAFGRSKSMAVPFSARGMPMESSSSADSAVQFRPLGAAPPIPDGADVGPHYVFLVHGWLGNEQEMSYLATALSNVVGGRTLSLSTDTVDDDDASGAASPIRSNDEDEDEDDYIHVSSNQEGAEAEEAVPGEEEEEDEGRPKIVIHKPTCNNGRTTDGIAAGGTRLAEEIAEFIVADVLERQTEQDGSMQHHVTVSFVGNSLGGLYSRYALSLLPSELPIPSEDGLDTTTVILHPNVFCTTATPHLGVASHTYLPVPRFAERAIGRVLDITGMDLFRVDAADYPKTEADSNVNKENVQNDSSNVDEDEAEARDDEPLLQQSSTEADEAEAETNEKPTRDLIYRMCTEPAYLNPLASFRERIAYANAFGTDFQVPTNTAAFLSDRSTYPHRYCNVAEKEGIEFIASVLYTDPSDNAGTCAHDTAESPSLSEKDTEDDLLVMSRSLDALGWTKVFIDTRGGIPVPALPKPRFMRRTSEALDVRAELKKFINEKRTSSVGAESEGTADELPVPVSLQRRRDQRPEVEAGGDANDGDQDERLSSVMVFLQSKELVELMNPSERMHFPLGHTVMVANSKSEAYAKINSKGKPIMNKLATDLVASISDYSG